MLKKGKFIRKQRLEIPFEQLEASVRQIYVDLLADQDIKDLYTVTTDGNIIINAKIVIDEEDGYILFDPKYAQFGMPGLETQSDYESALIEQFGPISMFYGENDNPDKFKRERSSDKKATYADGSPVPEDYLNKLAKLFHCYIALKTTNNEAKIRLMNFIINNNLNNDKFKTYFMAGIKGNVDQTNHKSLKMKFQTLGGSKRIKNKSKRTRKSRKSKRRRTNKRRKAR